MKLLSYLDLPFHQTSLYLFISAATQGFTILPESELLVPYVVCCLVITIVAKGRSTQLV